MRTTKAFTLVEMLVVVAIVSLLSTVAAVGLQSARVKARDARRKVDLHQVQTALELYYAENGTYPDGGGSGGETAICASDWPCWVSGGLFANALSKYIPQLPQDPHYANRGTDVSCNKWLVYVYEKKANNSYCLAGTLENTSDPSVRSCTQSCHRAWPNYSFSN